MKNRKKQKECLYVPFVFIIITPIINKLELKYKKIIS